MEGPILALRVMHREALGQEGGCARSHDDPGLGREVRAGKEDVGIGRQGQDGAGGDIDPGPERDRAGGAGMDHRRGLGRHMGVGARAGYDRQVEPVAPVEPARCGLQIKRREVRPLGIEVMRTRGVERIGCALLLKVRTPAAPREAQRARDGPPGRPCPIEHVSP